jgi:hypothetical protein
MKTVMNPHLFKMLKTSAEADKAKAMLTIEILSNNPAGIGDHSTDDFYRNAEDALKMLIDADDRLDALKMYFEQ